MAEKALADPVGGALGARAPLTPGFEAPKLSFLGPLLIVLLFFFKPRSSAYFLGGLSLHLNHLIA